MAERSMTMVRSDARSCKRNVPAFLTQGFRPFFLAAGLWAAVALALWIVMFVTGSAVPSRFDPLTWHIHEMLFGFVMAAIAGFLLTAIPNWTGWLPVQRRTLGAAGRAVAAGAHRLPALRACSGLDRHSGGPGVPGGPGPRRRPGDRHRAELAQPGVGGVTTRSVQNCTLSRDVGSARAGRLPHGPRATPAV